MRRESNRSSGKDNPPSAKTLALNLVEACKRSGADPGAVIEALSVVLGMVIVHALESQGEAEACEIADIAMRTIHRAIATHAEDQDSEQGAV